MAGGRGQEQGQEQGAGGAGAGGAGAGDRGRSRGKKGGAPAAGGGREGEGHLLLSVGGTITIEAVALEARSPHGDLAVHVLPVALARRRLAHVSVLPAPLARARLGRVGVRVREGLCRRSLLILSHVLSLLLLLSRVMVLLLLLSRSRLLLSHRLRLFRKCPRHRQTSQKSDPLRPKRCEATFLLTHLRSNNTHGCSQHTQPRSRKRMQKTSEETISLSCASRSVCASDLPNCGVFQHESGTVCVQSGIRLRSQGFAPNFACSAPSTPMDLVQQPTFPASFPDHSTVFHLPASSFVYSTRTRMRHCRTPGMRYAF